MPDRSTVTVPAEDWAQLHRRLGFLEAQAMRPPVGAAPAAHARPPFAAAVQDRLDAPSGELPENAAPPWVLPLLRLLKGEARGNLARAWRLLPGHLPGGTALPEPQEAATVLLRLGLA